MDAWAKAREVGDKILVLAGGNVAFVRAMGLEIDSSRFGMGSRVLRILPAVSHLAELDEPPSVG